MTDKDQERPGKLYEVVSSPEECECGACVSYSRGEQIYDLTVQVRDLTAEIENLRVENEALALECARERLHRCIDLTDEERQRLIHSYKTESMKRAIGIAEKRKGVPPEIRAMSGVPKIEMVSKAKYDAACAEIKSLRRDLRALVEAVTDASERLKDG